MTDIHSQSDLSFFTRLHPDRLSLPGNFTKNTDVVIIQVYDNEVEGQLLESIFLSKHPKDIPGLTEPVSINTTIDAYNDRAEIKMTSNKLAMFVVLTCRAQGRFSENAVVLRPGEAKVKLVWMKSMTVATSTCANSPILLDGSLSTHDRHGES
jgi:hypothetical protein